MKTRACPCHHPVKHRGRRQPSVYYGAVSGSCDEKSESYKAKYKNNYEIGKERICRTGKKLLEADNQITTLKNNEHLDFDFKIFKLDSSNLKT